MAEKLQVVIDVSTEKALKQTVDLAKATGKLSDSLDDASSAADKVADALDASTAAMVADLKAADKAAAALGTALGPELSAKIGTDKLDQFIGKLRSAGLSFEDIEGGAERFADSLRKMDAAADSFDNVQQAAARTNDEMGKSKGVLANFVGNAAQELPGLSGAFGPLNTAIGQFAEYAAEGDINLGQFMKAAGPVAAIGIGFAALTAIMGELGKHEKAVKEQSEKLLSVQEKLADAQFASAAQDLVDQYGDLIHNSKEFGLSTRDVINIMQNNGTGLDDLKAKYKALQDATEDRWGTLTQQEMDAYKHQSYTYQKLIEQLTIAQEAYASSGDTAMQAGADIEEVTKILGDNAAANDSAADAQARHTQEVAAAQAAAQGLLETETALTEAYLRRNDTLFSVEETQLNLDNTYADLIKSEADLKTTLDDGKKSADDKAKALRDLRLKQIDAAQAVMDAATSYSDSQGAVEGSNTAIAIQIGYLEDQKKRYPELSAMIDEYIRNLKKIPSQVETRVQVVGGSRKYAAGTNFHPGGVALVGEQGPELVDLPRGSRVHTAAATRNMARTGTLNSGAAVPAGGIVINVLSADPRQVVEAIRQYEAQNGAL